MRKKLILFLLLALPLWAQVQFGGNVQVSGTTLICATPSEGTVATPTASPVAGTYSSAQSVALSTITGGATICYTTDGTTPTATAGSCTHGTTYSTAISVSTTQTIKAIGTLSGYTNSGILSAAYTITGGTATPILVPFATPMNTGDNANTAPSPVLAFGKQGIGTSSWAVPISISNCGKTLDSHGIVIVPACTGSGSVVVTSMAISGTNASDFALAGSCGTIASGSDCEPTITFTPSASSGTDESAVLTVNYSGAVASSQSMNLTGTSATVTAESGCFTPASSTNYQLSGDVTGAGSCIVFPNSGTTSNVDINLNGHTITYCNSDEPAMITAYSASGNTVTITAENNFAAGDQVAFNITSGPTFLNGSAGNPFSGVVSSTGLSSSQFEVTYKIATESGSGSASGTAGILAGAVYVPNGGGTQLVTIHNGTIVHGAGSCPGYSGSNGYMNYGFGSGAFTQASEGATTGSEGTSMFNLNVTVSDIRAKVLFEEYGGSTTSLGTTVHDIYYDDEDSGSCGQVGCRAGDQWYPIVVDQSAHAGPSNFYNISGQGGTQGGIVTTAPNSNFTYNTLNPGNVTATNSNGFAIQAWGTDATVSHNVIRGNGIGGACLSCRGIQISSANNVAVTGDTISYNYVSTTQLPNNYEYGSPGCQGGGAYTAQLNTAGSGKDLSNNTFSHNTFLSVAGPCPGVAFSFSNATNAAGPNELVDNYIECDLYSGATTNICTGFQSLAHEYSPSPDGSIVSTGDTINGDVQSIYLGYDGTSSGQFNNDTFGKGTNPSGSYVMFQNYTGYSTGSSSSLQTLVDPTFVGTTASSNNLASFATYNPTLTSAYLISWTYTITVEQASNSAPISGATVSITPANSGTPCSTTTNGSGVATCILPDTQYQAVSGTYSTPSYNPMAITVTKAGCTTGSYSESITATTSETKKLSGC